MAASVNEVKTGMPFNTHSKTAQVLPIGKIVVEVASFDIQKIKNPEIKGAEYQQGVQSDILECT